MSRAVEESNRRMLRARDAMDRDYAKPLDILTLARIAFVSEAHFIRTFRATFGETPHRYLQRRRVERAMFLLRETDRSVTDKVRNRPSSTAEGPPDDDNHEDQDNHRYRPSPSIEVLLGVVLHIGKGANVTVRTSHGCPGGGLLCDDDPGLRSRDFPAVLDGGFCAAAPPAAGW